MLQSSNFKSHKASKQSPSTNILSRRKSRLDDGATHAPEAVGIGTLRSSYEIERLRQFVFQISELLWLEMSYKQELVSYGLSKGTSFFPLEDDGINPFFDRTQPLPKGHFKWSDYQIEVEENMREGLKALQSDIMTIATRMSRFLTPSL